MRVGAGLAPAIIADWRCFKKYKAIKRKTVAGAFGQGQVLPLHFADNIKQ
jgi:hypothetical protein